MPLPYTQVAAISRMPGQIDLFVMGASGHVYTAWWSINSNQDYQPGHKWKDIGGIFPASASIVAVSRKPGQLDLFCPGNDKQAYTSSWTAGGEWTGIHSSWENIGGSSFYDSSISAVSRNPDQIDVFGNRGDVYTTWNEGPRFTGSWRNISGSYPSDAELSTGTVAAVSRKRDQIDLFVLSGNGRVRTCWWPDWSSLGWRDIGGNFPPTPLRPITAISRSAEQLDLFICDGDGHVRTSAWAAGKDWSGLGDFNWWDIGGVFPDLGVRVAAVSPWYDRLDLFICSGDGIVYTSRWQEGRRWSGENNNWSPVQLAPPTFPAAAPVTAVSCNPSQIDLFIVGGDGNVYTTRSRGTVLDWQPWRIIGTSF